MDNVFTDLAATHEGGFAAYSKKYMESAKSAISVISDPSLLKSQIKTNNFDNAESILRFSLVFNDLSLLTLSGGRVLHITTLSPKWFEDHFGTGGASVRIDPRLLKELGINPKKTEVIPGFIFPSGESADRVLKKLTPFIEKGKLLLQPDRSLFYHKDDKTDVGRRHWHSLNVSQFSSLQDWEILDEQVSRPIPFNYDTTDHLDQISMFDITMPYIEGVSFEDLLKILEDEEDLVSGVRLSIKEAISEYGTNVDPRVVAKDIIDPKIDALNRKFKSTINSHAFRIAGASVGTVVLTYTAAATFGLSSAIATVCGSGGFGLLLKEYSTYKEKINTFKDDPHYFLWRCKNASKKI